jgi:hypothetical protein
MNQTALAEAMAEQGRPLSRTAVLRIEKGTRPLLLDEALALAEVQKAVPSQLLSPREPDYLMLTGKVGVDGEDRGRDKRRPEGST